jgi:hypothetical protein
MKEIKINSAGHTEAWCMKYISPRLFYIHDKCGGPGWMIVRKNGETILQIEDEKKYLLALLKFGK